MFHRLSFLPLIALGLVACTTTNKNSSSSEPKESVIPQVTKPKVNCSMVPDSIEGNKWIEKHRVCIIDSPSTWSR